MVWSTELIIIGASCKLKFWSGSHRAVSPPRFPKQTHFATVHCGNTVPSLTEAAASLRCRFGRQRGFLMESRFATPPGHNLASRQIGDKALVYRSKLTL